MLVILGSAIGIWFLYLIIALIAKHKKALVISTIIGVVAGMSSIIAVGDEANTLFGSLLFCFLTSIIPQLQVNNEVVDEERESKNVVQNQNYNKPIENNKIANEKRVKHEYKKFDNAMMRYSTIISPGNGVFSGVSYYLDVDYFYNLDNLKLDEFKSMISEVIVGLFYDEYQESDTVKEYEFMVFITKVIDRIKGLNQEIVTTLETHVSNKLNDSDLFDLSDAKIFLFEAIDKYYQNHQKDFVKPLRTTRKEPNEDTCLLVSYKEGLDLSNRFKDLGDRFNFKNLKMYEDIHIDDSNCRFYIFDEVSEEYNFSSEVKYLINVTNEREDCYFVVRYTSDGYCPIEYIDFRDGKPHVVEMGLIASNEKHREKVFQRTYAYLKRLIEEL